MTEHTWRCVARETLTDPAEYEYTGGRTSIDVEHGGLSYECQTVVLGSDAGEPIVTEMSEWQIDGEDVDDDQIPRTVRELVEAKAIEEANRV